MTVVTIVLASGRGTRLGGPKALLAWRHHDETIPLAVAHVRSRMNAESARALIVTRDDIAERLAPHIANVDGAELVISHATDEQGAAGSIAAAMAALDVLEDTLLLLTPVDCPPASTATAQVLLARLRADETLLAARPQHGSRRGHPVVLRAAALEPYRQGQAPPLRDRLRELGDAVVDVAVNDARVLADIDTEQDFADWARWAEWNDAELSFIGLPG